MIKAKKILSILLVAALVLGIAPVSALTTIASAYEYTRPDAVLTDGRFTAAASATEVVRVAYAINSFAYGDATSSVIVQATPSGVPYSSNTFDTIAYAGETPAAPTISLALTGAVASSTPTVAIAGGSNITLSTPATTTAGSTTTYTWTIAANGTSMAWAGNNLTYTITYTVNGKTYTNYAASHVENINSPTSILPYRIKDNASSDGGTSRMSALIRLMSKNSYSSMNAGTQNGDKVGYINFAMDIATANSAGSANLGVGSENYLSMSSQAMLCDRDNTYFSGTKPSGLFKSVYDSTGTWRNISIRDDGNRPMITIYMDKGNTAEDTLADLNFRMNVLRCEDSNNVNVKTGGAPSMMAANYEYADDTSPAASTVSTSLLASTADTTTITTKWGMRSYPITGAGFNLTTTAQSAEYTICPQVSGTNSNGNVCSSWVGIATVINVYNTTDLQALINGIRAGTGSYTSVYLPYITTTYTNSTTTFNKGANPQSWYYTGGWSTFETAWKAALAVLATPDTNQTAINDAYKALATAYNGLTGYNSSVSWEVRYFLSSTTTALIPAQSGTSAAGYTLSVAKANITGFECITESPAVEYLSGATSTKQITFYYSPINYNVMAATNNDNQDLNIVSFPFDTAIIEASIPYGTKLHYNFAGWYYDNGNPVSEGGDGSWDSPVNFTGLKMPVGGMTIYARWQLAPVYVVYDTAGAGTMASTSYTPGDTTTAPTAPSFPGYLFAGWYTDAAYTTQVTWGFTMGYDNVTVYGKFVDVNGKIAYITNGGTSVPDTTGLIAGSVVPAPSSTRAGYTLTGWYYDEAFTQPITWPVTMTSSTGFLAYAKWAPTQQSISFNLGPIVSEFDTTSIAPIYGYTDTAVAAQDIPANPRKFGYIFNGWTYQSAPYSFTTYPPENITVNAGWTATKYDAVIEVDTFKEEYGTATPITTARAGDTVLVRMTSTTNFFTGSSLFVFMFDHDFYTLQGSGSSAFDVNTSNDYISGINATYSGVTNSNNLNWPASLQSQAADYDAIQIAIDPTVGITQSEYNAEPMADGTWMVEFRLTVNAGATGSGEIYMDNAWTRNASNPMGSMFYGWCPLITTPVFDSVNNVVTPDLTYASASVALDQTTAPTSTVILQTNGGAFPDSTTTKTYTGECGQAIPGYAQPTRTGHTLASWVNTVDSNDTWIAGYYGAISATYNAQWTANQYTATFYRSNAPGATVYTTQNVTYGTNITAPTNPTLTGYVFNGWVDASNNAVTLPMATPDSNTNFYATWIPNPNTAYKIGVTYINPTTSEYVHTTTNKTGTTGYTVTVVETVPVPAAPNTIYLTYAELPAIAGGNFVYDPSSPFNETTDVILADGTMVLELRYKPIDITVTFNGNGGIFSENSTSTYTVSSYFGQLVNDIKPANPTRTGYTFSAWSPVVGETTRVNNTVYKSFTAQWTANQYPATFNAGAGYFNGDTNDHEEVIQVSYGSNITAPTAPVRPGYTFLGWSTDGTTVLGSLGTMNDVSGKTFTAVYQLTNYYVYYYLGGTLSSTETYNLGNTVTVIANATKTGYTFNGWTSTDVTISGAGSTFSMPASNVRIDGTFTANNYNATFYAIQGDATAYATVSTAFDSTIVPPATDPTRAGYQFSGWALSTNPGTVVDDVVMNSTAGLTFYGVWAPISQTYYIDIYLADTSGTYPSSPSETQTATALTGASVSFTAPARTGFTYSSADSVASGIIPATGNLRLSIYYTRNQYLYTIKYANGTSDATAQVYYNASISAPTTPTLVGYTFSQWVIDGTSTPITYPMTMPAAAFTAKATYTINSHNAYFYTKSGDATPFATVSNVVYGTAITPPATNPSVTGYTFTGWSPAVGTMVDNDMTFVAVLTANSYNATFNANGGVFADSSTSKIVPTNYDSQIVAPADPTRTGYTFSGWTPTVGIMNDVNGKTFTAVWTANLYPATFNANGGKFADDTTSKVVQTAFDATPVAPANPTRAGYNFTGWSPALNVMNTVGGESYTAQWSANTNTGYTVKVYTMNTSGNYTAVTPVSTAFYDGTTDAYKTLVSGTHYTIPGAGYALDTTLSDVGGTISGLGTTTFNVYIKRNSYTFATIVDGVTTSSTSYVFGATIPTPTSPTKQGYSFTGWSPAIPSTMPASNLTVTAQWAAANVNYTINTYEMGLDGLYPATPTSSTTGTGLTGSTATTSFVAKTGFTNDVANSVLSAVILANGSTVLTVKYIRSQYDFSVDNANGSSVTTTTYYYGASVTAPAQPTRTGYTFSSWSPAIPVTMPAANTTVVAQWTINSYNVNYYDAFVSTTTPIYTTQVDYNADIEAYTEQHRTGYTFLGWAYTSAPNTVLTFPIVMGTADVDFIAVWQINSYTATFRSQGVVVNTQTVAYGGNIVSPADPVRTGYTFKGWALQGTSTVLTFPQVMGTADVNYIAQWTINSYDITYYVDGAVYQTQTYTYNAAVTPLAEPTQSGYTFSGWNETIPSTMPANNVSITGTFTANDYTVTYSYATTPAGATALPSNISDAHIGQVINLTAPTAPGYTFDGWVVTGAASVIDDTSFTMGAGNVTVAGSWTANEQTYYVEVYYMTTAGSYSATADDTLEFTADTDESVSYTMPAVTGFTADTANSTLAGVIPATGSLTLVAKYSRNQYTFTETVDGTNRPATTYYYGEAVATPADGVKTGYTFTGWSPAVPATMPASNVTVVAQFTINSHDIVYKVDGVETNRYTYDYGTALTAIAAPTKVGYTFSGWSAVPATMPDNDVEVNGTFSINTYTIYYFVDGTAYDSDEYQYNAVVTAIAEPTKTGHTFSGWATVPATMPANNVNVYGTFTANTYTVTFISEGSTFYGPTNTVYGTAVATPPSTPVKNGYTFAGWDAAVPATMPANNLTFNATWTANVQNYTVAIYQMRVDGTYSPTPTSTIPLTAATGTSVSYTMPAITGFTADTANSTLSGIIPDIGNLTLTAKYTRNQYTFTETVDGVDRPATTYYYGAIIDTPADGVKTGYTFTGWLPTVPETMPAENVTVTAQFTVNSYTVTFLDADGNVFDTQEVVYGTAITLPATTPTKEFYTFTAWDSVPATMPANDITISPIFDRVPVTIKLVAASTAIIDTTDATAEVNGYIYGLRRRLTTTVLLSTYLAVEGDGHLVITPTKYNMCGTGTRVDVYDNVTSEIVETYYLVIFGDLNGDSDVDNTDAGIVSNEVLAYTDWSDTQSENYNHSKVLAADLSGNDHAITSQDRVVSRDIALKRAVVDQATAQVTYPDAG